VDRTDLKYPLFKPAIPKVFKFAATPNDIFEAIQQKTILLHHPYDSFSPVVDFLFAAARDPNVLAIKQTLYRVGQNSPIVDALLEASEHGKEVAVLVELKARFDEESNIGWARKLEQAGVHVIYGLVGLKTHCKVALVIRKEGTGIRRYLHLATGNYNPTTARCYEDIGLFTCDENLGADATDLFNYLTGYSTKQDYRQLLVAPLNLRNQLVDLIQREIGHARAGLKTHIIIKVNGLTDPDIINLLYLASQAGVKIDLLIRGICCLRPGVKGLSESISVISVVGQYLEHSRIFYFLNGGQEEIYLGSADLMQRNLNQRVEVVFPIKTKEQIRYLRDEVLESYLHDNSHARILNSDGKYLHVQPDSGAEEVNVQNILMNIERNQ
jgi:polyphosphate kinase